MKIIDAIINIDYYSLLLIKHIKLHMSNKIIIRFSFPTSPL